MIQSDLYGNKSYQVNPEMGEYVKINCTSFVPTPDGPEEMHTTYKYMTLEGYVNWVCSNYLLSKDDKIVCFDNGAMLCINNVEAIDLKDLIEKTFEVINSGPDVVLDNSHVSHGMGA